MKLPQRAASKEFDYPEETPGSRLVAKARELANKLTPEQRREHFNEAIARAASITGRAAKNQIPFSFLP